MPLSTTALETRNVVEKLSGSHVALKNQAAQILSQLGSWVASVDALNTAVTTTHKAAFTADEQTSPAALKAEVVAQIQALIA